MGVNEVKKENLQRAYTKLPRYIDDIFLSYDFPGKNRYISKTIIYSLQKALRYYYLHTSTIQYIATRFNLFFLYFNVTSHSTKDVSILTNAFSQFAHLICVNSQM